jgi:hypothetical protein
MFLDGTGANLHHGDQMRHRVSLEFLGKNDEVGLHFGIERASDLKNRNFCRDRCARE